MTAKLLVNNYKFEALHEFFTNKLPHNLYLSLETKHHIPPEVIGLLCHFIIIPCVHWVMLGKNFFILEIDNDDLFDTRAHIDIIMSMKNIKNYDFIIDDSPQQQRTNNDKFAPAVTAANGSKYAAA